MAKHAKEALPASRAAVHYHLCRKPSSHAAWGDAPSLPSSHAAGQSGHTQPRSQTLPTPLQRPRPAQCAPRRPAHPRWVLCQRVRRGAPPARSARRHTRPLPTGTLARWLRSRLLQRTVAATCPPAARLPTAGHPSPARRAPRACGCAWQRAASRCSLLADASAAGCEGLPRRRGLSLCRPAPAALHTLARLHTRHSRVELSNARWTFNLETTMSAYLGVLCRCRASTRL